MKILKVDTSSLFQNLLSLFCPQHGNCKAFGCAPCLGYYEEISLLILTSFVDGFYHHYLQEPPHLSLDSQPRCVMHVYMESYFMLLSQPQVMAAS